MSCDGVKEADNQNGKQIMLLEELIIEILLWLPAKSISKFRCVCKSWRALFSDSSFVDTHLHRSIQRDNFSLFFECSPDLFNLHSPHFQLLHHEPRKLDFSFQHNSHSLLSFAAISSCNGLICLLMPGSNSIYLLNPSTRSYKQLPSPPVENMVISSSLSTPSPFFDFGYSSFNDGDGAYKVLRLIYAPGSTLEDTYLSEVQVYTIGSVMSSWKRRSLNLPGYIIYSPGTLLKGSLHWVVARGGRNFVIFSFNIGDEEFRDVPLLDFMNVNFSMPFLGVLRGRLCLFGNFVWDQHEHIKIWTMEEYGITESWTLKFTIGHPSIFRNPDEYFRPLRFLQNDDILLMTCHGKLVMYSSRQKEFRDLTFRGMRSLFGTIPYVESLVPIKVEEENPQPQCA